MTTQQVIRRGRELRGRNVTIKAPAYNSAHTRKDELAKFSGRTLPAAWIAVGSAACLVSGLWSYWPTLENLVATWSRVPDYSHGFLVVPMALLFAWIRRDTCPGLSSASLPLAAALLFLSLLVRHAGDAFYFTFLDGWSLLPWTAAMVALVGGWPLLRWRYSYHASQLSPLAAGFRNTLRCTG